MRYRDIITEARSKASKKKSFLKKREADFKERYGDVWQRVLHATANKIFGGR